MRANRGLVLRCAVLVLLACFATEAKDESGAKTILVDCEKGDSINEALDDKADDLIIEISGTCQEDVVIKRNNVTLRGVMPGASVVAATTTAIFLDRVSRVSLENLSAQGGTDDGRGVSLWFSTAVSVSDVWVENGQSDGMKATGSEVLITDSHFRNNEGDGLDSEQSSLVFLEGEVEFTGNRGKGLFLALQSRLTSVAAIHANGNEESGIELVAHSSATLVGPLQVMGNGLDGIFVGYGSVLCLVEGDVEVSANANGMTAKSCGQIHMDEESWANVHGNTIGVYLHGSSATFHDVTIEGNTSSDVVLLFGSRADFEGSNTAGTVICDQTALVEGDVSCPVP
jgi:hypothetical protein